jgi:hypothetical protein
MVRLMNFPLFGLGGYFKRRSVMDKGIVVTTTVKLLLGVALLLVLFSILGVIPAAGTWIYEWIMSALGIYGPTEFEEAIACSYWRCAEGCDSPKIVGLLDGKCRRDFCAEVPPDFKEGNKICGENALQYPVLLEGFESDKIFDREKFNPPFTCVIPTDWVGEGGINFNTFMVGLGVSVCGISLFIPPAALVACPATFLAWWATGVTLDYNNLIINHTIVTHREEEACHKTGLTVSADKALKKFSIDSKGDPLYFSTSYRIALLGIWGHQYLTMVTTLPQYIRLDTNQPRNLWFAEPSLRLLKYRVVTDEGDYIFWIDVNASVTIIYDYPTCGDYNVTLYIMKGEEIREAVFTNGDKERIFDFDVELLELVSDCSGGWAYGSAKFTVTYAP